MTAKRACVIGWPINHSRSPLIHNYWIKLHGVEGSYTREAVAPDDVKAFLTHLEERGFAGCNVTLPHKEAAFSSVRIADEATQKLGVVNTVFRREGITWGTSTDGEGFLANLKSGQPGWLATGKRIAVFGAGGAARAIVATLVDQKAGEVAVFNRTLERAEILRRDFGKTVKPMPWDRAADALSDAEALVNTTSLGMKGQPELDLNIEKLPAGALVTDIIYVPIITSLLVRAKERGNPIVTGLGMLLHQAVRGFELWFGVRPGVTQELYDLVAADVERGSAA
jgi:shikimate dehydrogenase